MQGDTVGSVSFGLSKNNKNILERNGKILYHIQFNAYLQNIRDAQSAAHGQNVALRPYVAGPKPC